MKPYRQHRQGPRVIVEPTQTPVEACWQLVEAILRGIPEPADRARWVLRWLPRTAVMLGIDRP